MERSIRQFVTIATLLLAASAACAAERHAKNVVLFIGDAGGIPTLNAASLYVYGEPQKLFIQHMSNIALMNTSAANAWVTDSAAGMSAIVTGHKTDNGVLSQLGRRNGSDGAPLKTILEYAEEHGLSTGVISNMAITDATPAACYSHVSDRGKTAEIFSQLLAPLAGDGPDVVIGAGRNEIFTAADRANLPIRDAIQKSRYQLFEDPAAIPATASRVMALTDSPFEAAPAVHRAIDILSRNRKGFFLMVEWDMHTSHLKEGLENAGTLDKVIASVAQRLSRDTLILFAADHSYDLRLRGGKPGDSLLPPDDQPAPKKPVVRVEDAHTGEEVLLAAQGPGAQRVHGFMANTDVFRVMMNALGFAEQPTSRETGEAVAGAGGK